MYIDKQALYESFLSRGFDDACARLMAGLDQAILEEEKPKLEKKLDDIARKSNIDSQDVTKKINNVKQNIARLYEDLKDVVEKYRNGENDQPEDTNVEPGSKTGGNENNKEAGVSGENKQEGSVEAGSENASGKNQNEGNESNAEGTTISEAIIEFDDGADKDAKTGANTEQKKEENTPNQNGTTVKNNQQQSQQNQQKSPDQSAQNASTEDGGGKKYELTDETFEIGGRVLHRIRALKNFGAIKEGDVGGLIESEKNLSQEGNCWVDGDAMVADDANVSGDALILGNAQVYENAVVKGNAEVEDTAKVHGSAQVFGRAKICGDAEVCENGQVNYEVSKGVIKDKLLGGDRGNAKNDTSEDTDRPKKVARTKKFPPLNYKTEDGKVLGDIVKDIRANTLELLQLAIQMARMENNRRWKEREAVLRDQKATAEAIEEERGNFSELSHRDIYKFIFGEDGHGIRLDVFRIDEFKNIE